jgi:4-hydroxy-2-oxoheptanedioate aldolase
MSVLATNTFKRGLAERKLQIGYWMGLGDAIAAEICAGAGFDWVTIDAEHGVNDQRSVLAQLQAIAPYPTQAIVRSVDSDPAKIKQYLDIGAQTILIPLVNSAREAEELVRATRYPPRGIRGVAPAVVRAARWGAVEDYIHKAHEETALIVQVETRTALDNLDEIARVEGVDGVFIGPADLSASLGHPGDANHPEVVSAIKDAAARINAVGRCAGSLATDPDTTRQYLDFGILFLAVGSDVGTLRSQTAELVRTYKA